MISYAVLVVTNPNDPMIRVAILVAIISDSTKWQNYLRTKIVQLRDELVRLVEGRKDIWSLEAK